MSEKDYKGPMRFAHRGLVQYAPENTLGAFEAAIDHGFEGMEIDVGVSLDGEIIVAHDSNFTRMTLGHPTGFSNKRLKDINWSDIVKTELPYANHMLPKETSAVF
jgi:glycerophosphoryl diester phosphodiesterase